MMVEPKCLYEHNTDKTEKQHCVKNQTEVLKMKKLYIITGAAGHLGNTIIRMLRNMAVETRGLILPNEEVQEKETFGI